MKESLQKSALVFAAILFLLLVACTDPMLGKKFPVASYPHFGEGSSGYHQIPFEKGTAELNYKWFIDNEIQTITLEGTYKMHFGEWELFKKSPIKSGALTIVAYLLNQNYEVINVERIFFPIDKDSELERKFKKTFSFNREYKFITFKINFRGSY